MITQFFGVFVMILFLDVALDVSTREVVSFAISDSLARPGARAVLSKVAFSGIHPGKLVEVDRVRLGIRAEPDTA
jgi:hypothetical protein